MKILYIITQGELGGAQRYVLDLAKHFGQGHEIVVANATDGDQWLAKEWQQAKAGGAIHQFKHLVREINPLKDLLAFFEIRRYIKQLQPDIIHTNSTKASVLVAFAKGKIPSIYTVHGWVFNEPMHALQRQLYLWLERLACRRHNNIVVLGDHDRRIAVDYLNLPEKKLHVIPHGIVLTAIPPRANQYHEPVELVTIANFYATKGLVHLIDAVQILHREAIPVRLTIFGDGPLRFTLFDRAVGSASIVFAGRVADAVAQLPHFDIFILPSLKEGFPYAILEAMNAKLPIIATMVGEIPHILENEKTGLLVPPADAQALANAIKHLIQNKTFADHLAANATERLKIFSFDEMMRQYEELYRVIAG